MGALDCPAIEIGLDQPEYLSFFLAWNLDFDLTLNYFSSVLSVSLW